ncbi:RagB/SusD family nutrient uptake outer membrane protein [Porphyromonas asaccharolytica]|uniref:RagB/SusD family nutrient uptake outer membrane protein n=1 Tax=Porphyromonas asaccharolytica TaxID=28123 RepID=UPI00248E052C|nr:RagB/SusD family nutrient uptake outer membrane protein [Porphyromonas asaccharolytica]
MKQHIKTLGLLLVSLLALAACKVEYIPEGNKAQVEFKTMQDVKWTREAMFETARGSEAPGNLIIGDYQADLYNVVNFRDNGANGKFYDWDEQLLRNADEVAAYYGSYCSLIKDANYFIMRAEEFKANEELTKNLSDQDKLNIEIYIAEARTFRALAHYRLMTRFSKRYNDANDGGDLGIVMMKKYDPLLKETPKARSTQKEVYEWCLNELAEAAKVLPTKAAYNDLLMDGIPCYLVDDYAYAIRARIFLEMHKYAEAIAEVEKFIENYPLSTQGVAPQDNPKDKTALQNLWKYETSTEIMIKTYANKKVGRVGGALHGIRFLKGALSDGSDVELAVPVWLPSQYLLDLYNKPIDTNVSQEGKDWRYTNWFEGSSNSGPNGVAVFVYDTKDLAGIIVSKFRGNPDLDQDRAKKLFSYAHTTHLFDIAEAWLIKAEAEAWSGDVAGAKATLQDFRMARGLGDELKATTQDQIKQAVMNERTREMVGMGTRMTDLKRWQVDLDRKGKPAQPALAGKPGALHEKSLDMHKSHTDKMFIWEFPLQDRFANKELIANW